MRVIARTPRLRRTLPAVTIGVLATLLTGCAASRKDSEHAHDPATGLLAQVGDGDCQSLTTNTISVVAQRIYAEVADGPVISEAAHRMSHSTRLLRAVRRDEPRAVHKALMRLSEGQIVRARVLRGRHVLSEIGGSPAIAPLRVPLKGPAGATIGTLVISTQGTRAFIDTLGSLTGARVALSGDDQDLRGAPAGSSRIADGLQAAPKSSFDGVYSLAGEAFPMGRLRATLLIPQPPAWVCTDSVAQTVTNTIGLVAERIYRDEHSGVKVARVVQTMQHSARFVRAVAEHDAGQARSSIIGFFRSHLHVVRVRVTAGSKFLVDVGGPHVLAPVSGSLRLGGRVIGHFIVAIQDDTGFLKLVHLFTTAQVLVRPGRQRPLGTLPPTDASLQLPATGGIKYRGSAYAVYSFAARSFPAGPLRISLLLPDG